jgi:hypothetical protein
MATKKEQIIKKAFELLSNEPNGIRYTDLVNKINECISDIPINTVHGTIWNIETKFPKEIYKPSRGIFKLTKFQSFEEELNGKIPTKIINDKIKEEDFYQSFADWLVNDLEECTKAIKLGSKYFKDKWMTPDVIGVRESKRSDIIRLPTEIISAEIKLDSNGLITAFGQACSYKLFSHRSYIVIPKNSSEDDIGRLDALSRIFGIGLILFDNSNYEKPDFIIRNRANKHEPDMFYVNKNLSIIEEDLFK